MSDWKERTISDGQLWIHKPSGMFIKKHEGEYYKLYTTIDKVDTLLEQFVTLERAMEHAKSC